MFHPHHTRRRFLGGSLASLLSLGLNSPVFASSNDFSFGKAKRCVLLWMNGGPSQFETFDPKPGTSTGGPTRAIQTSVPGLQLASGLSKLAKRMEQLCILRNVSSQEGEHVRAQYYLHTGFRMVPAFPRPAIGSLISHQRPETDLPKYVLLGGRDVGPAYCGPDHASFSIENADTANELLAQAKQRVDDIGFLRSLNADFDTRNRFPNVQRRSSMVSRIERLVSTPFREALNLERESAKTKQRYGDHEFGRRCLLARRLLELDVPFVEVQLDGWDTHIENFDAVSRLTAMIDSPWSALMDDLVAGGLWDDTLLVWMGDFGRTPLINQQNGRDHFPNVTPMVLGGGCVHTGQAIGSTNHNGTQINGDAHRVADVAATILHLLGVAADGEFTTTFGSPTTATDDGEAIRKVIAG